jgi:hypothetical protein
LVVGVLWGFAQFTAFDDPIWKRTLMAFTVWGIWVGGGGLMAWAAFRKPLPPKSGRKK